jgi:YebC/PmpR family DNA-binding regulatory protein
VAGHSKWANIQHRKGAQDKRRNQLFSKICREITVATKLGGGAVDNNPRLKSAILLAKKNSVPSKNIDNAIKKGTGEIEGGNYEEVSYEGYGPNGIAVFVETSTDNKNRTVSDVRARFTKSGGSLGANGSVDWMFERKGLITVDVSHYEVEDDLFELVIEAGAEDLKREENLYHIYTAFEDLFAVKDALEELSVVIESAEVTRVPQNMTEITDEDTAFKVLRLIDQLEELDDVMKVYANFDVSDELVEKVASRL